MTLPSLTALTWLAWQTSLAVVPVPPSLAVPFSGPVLVDTRCEAPEWSAALRTPIGEARALLLQQDARSVYLCIPLPAESYGTMDLYVLPAGASMPTNLHASAQVGERQRTAAGWPDWVFGNYSGWYSPPVALTASDIVDGRSRLTFGPVAAREVAIEKQKFGAEPWRVMVEVRALGPDKKGVLRYPGNASADSPETWSTLDLGANGSAAPGLEADTIAVASAALGETRSVWVHAPRACREETACDLLVVLDAHALFPLASAYASVMQAMGRMPPLIVVGVPSRSPGDRIKLFTSLPGDDERGCYPGAGGAGLFLQFLQQDVLPAVSARYRLSARHTLAGHSLGGLFVVDALASGAGFESYVAISPTLGWNRQHTLNALAPVLDRSTGAARRLYVSVANDTPAHVSGFERLEADVARRAPVWLRTAFQRFANEDHVTTVGPSLQAALKWLFVQEPGK